MCIDEREQWIKLLLLNKELNMKLKPIFESYFESFGWYGCTWQDKGFSGMYLYLEMLNTTYHATKGLSCEHCGIRCIFMLDGKGPCIKALLKVEHKEESRMILIFPYGAYCRKCITEELNLI